MHLSVLQLLRNADLALAGRVQALHQLHNRTQQCLQAYLAVLGDDGPEAYVEVRGDEEREYGGFMHDILGHDEKMAELVTSWKAVYATFAPGSHFYQQLQSQAEGEPAACPLNVPSLGPPLGVRSISGPAWLRALPAIGFGTGCFGLGEDRPADGDEAAIRVLLAALKTGYRVFDIAPW